MPAPRPTDALGAVYAEWAVEMEHDPEMSTELLRIIFDDWQRVTVEPEDVTYRETEIGGVPGILVTPLQSDPAQVLVLLHGGGFALGSSRSHRKLAGHLARAAGTTAFVPDFRLAPEHPFPAAIEDGVAVVRGLRDAGHGVSDVTLVGDSAGGNLAIATTLRLRELGEPLPPQVITMSPWLNMENTGATIDSNDATDFLITRSGLQANIDRYLGGVTSATHPLANPLHADLRGFPRLYVCAADTESLFDDSVQLTARARAAGVDVTFSVGAGMQHVFPFLAGRHPRADEEIARIADWYRAGR
ncbi:alpha/beta hydrolase [Leucobacter chromiireducens]|uniref:Alpha/beta hydrolase n=1 Tax=Leucobacter chromiireducens subsp. solipictus TaxID=398235 RepID=A0ABS1SM78_9MICO|nr:alpha/beta hydrolase [Leucobacter chromiireducens]MBL3680403.1 alpha/beta hydrolase [Leucobacter chromiireducens subsp. solipictus]